MQGGTNTVTVNAKIIKNHSTSGASVVREERFDRNISVTPAKAQSRAKYHEL